jgi:hypothetical protein
MPCALLAACILLAAFLHSVSAFSGLHMSDTSTAKLPWKGIACNKRFCAALLHFTPTILISKNMYRTCCDRLASSVLYRPYLK